MTTHDYITIDFETRSKCDIRKAGAWRYAEDESTEVICMSYKIKEEDVKIWKSIEGEPFPEDLETAIGEGLIIEAHNAEFEQAIMKHVVEKDIPIRQWRCSAAKTAAAALPRALGDATKALGLPVRKDEEGQRIMMQLARMRRPSATNPDDFWEPSTAPEKFERLYSYCDDDVAAEVGLSAVVPDLSESEQDLWFIDQEINQRGINVDIDSIQKILWCIDRMAEKLDKKTQRITNNELMSVRQRDAFIKYMKGKGYELPDATKNTIEEWAARTDLPEDIETLFKYRNVLSKTTTSKFQSMLDRVQADGKIRGTLMYHGASTGRWSGRGVQPQNLPRGTEKDIEGVIADFAKADIKALFDKYDNPFEAAASCIRAMIKASDGKTFYCADFASIEARALVWLAKDTRAIQMFERGEDVYIDMAAAIYKVERDNVTPEQRQIGKMAILGLGYGMGWKTFQKQSDKMGAPIEVNFAKMVVKKYREKYQFVSQFWSQLEAVAKAAVRNKGKVYGLHGVMYCFKDDYLRCKLPSGRIISYYKPALEEVETSWGEMKESITYWGVNGYTRKWEKQSTYGGKLVENVTQAVARDFMAGAMKRIDEAGYEIVLTVHDELVAEADEGFGSLEEFENLMAQRPEWALDCPIEAEGWTGKRYKK